MGACATKQKEGKAKAAEAPAPEPANEEVTRNVSDAQEVVVGEKSKKVDGEIGLDKDKEIVDDDKRRSLSNLFKEKEGKESIEQDMTQTHPVKQEELSANQNPTEVFYEANSNEFGKTETQVEQAPREVIEPVEVALTTVISIEKEIVSPGNIMTQEAEEKKIVEDKPVTAETQKSDTFEEKKIVEDGPVPAETKKSETSEKNKAVEEKLATVSQEPKTTIEEKTKEGN